MNRPKASLAGRPQNLFSTFSESDTFSFERALLRQGYGYIAGTDEAGRGPLAGPVVAASVILPQDCDYSIFEDSKKLSAAKREELAQELENIGAQVSFAVVSEETIDAINILQASLLAMKKSLVSLPVSPDYVLVDGKFKVLLAIEQLALVKGDSRSASISAASIVAKVERDKLMRQYHEQFPRYGFDKNKGYPTLAHRKAIRKFGVCRIHRKTFAGVREYL
jgi:ribonuclease HII